MFFNEAEAWAPSQAGGQEEDGEDDKVDVPAHKRTKRGRKPLDPALPREVCATNCPRASACARTTARPCKEIGVEASEQLDIIPQQVRVIRHERVKYACPCCDGSLRLAGKPAQIIPKGLFTEGAGLDHHLQVSRWVAAVPPGGAAGALRWHRLSRNTMAASVVRVGQAVQPVINLLRDHLLDAPWSSATRPRCRCSRSPGARRSPRATCGRR
jgi:transposase